MAAFENLPRINQLHTDELQVAKLIEMIDAKGELASVTVRPAPQPEPAPMPTMQGGPLTMRTPVGPPVSFQASGPTPDALMQALKSWLEQKRGEIHKELADLGVTGTNAP